MDPTARNYYEILGVAQDATAEEIHRAYRRLARQYHPDVSSSPDAGTRFDELSRAYEALHAEGRHLPYDGRSSAPIRQPVRRPRRAPRFAAMPHARDVPRFLDDEVEGPPPPHRGRTPVSAVVRWDLPVQIRSPFEFAPRRWREVRWLR